MKNWQIRRAQPSDATQFKECIAAAYAVYRNRIADLPAVTEGIEDDIANHNVWVAESNGEIWGGIVLVNEGAALRLANIAVDPKAKGQGLGGALISLAERECIELGYTEMRLSTHVDMPENVSLYIHLGWQEVERSGNKVKMSKTF